MRGPVLSLLACHIAHITERCNRPARESIAVERLVSEFYESFTPRLDGRPPAVELRVRWRHTIVNSPILHSAITLN